MSMEAPDTSESRRFYSLSRSRPGPLEEESVRQVTGRRWLETMREIIAMRIDLINSKSL